MNDLGTPPAVAADRIFHGYDITRLTMTNVLQEQSRRHGSRRFLRFLPDGRELTFADMDRLSNAYANRLAEQGIGKGHHVAVMMTNSPEQLLSYFALGKLGAVSVPVNNGARGDSLRHILDHADVTAVLADIELAQELLPLWTELPKIARIWTLGKGDLDCPVPRHDFRDLTTGPDHAPDAEVSYQDLAFINYTSGTTGPAKGVMLSHARALLWGLSHADAFGQNEHDTVYICLPMFHVNALQGASFNALLVGAEVVLQKRFSASGFWKDIREHDVSVTNLLGSMVNILWARPRDPLDAQNRLRMVMTVPLPAFATAFEERFGLKFTSGYSLTDYGPSHAFTLDDPPSKLGSAGRLRRGMQARIVDEHDFELPPGVPGELVIRSTIAWNSTSGYYRQPRETLASLRNGWFHTGDRCVIDQDGYMWFIDRKKDVIRRKGENISSFEVEQVILKHPAVADAAAYAVPSEMSEDELALSVILKDGHTLSPAQLSEWFRAVMPRYMWPRFLHFTDSVPRNLSQKIEKYKLREWAVSNVTTFWDRETQEGRG